MEWSSGGESRPNFEYDLGIDGDRLVKEVLLPPWVAARPEVTPERHEELVRRSVTYAQATGIALLETVDLRWTAPPFVDPAVRQRFADHVTALVAVRDRGTDEPGRDALERRWLRHLHHELAAADLLRAPLPPALDDRPDDLARLRAGRGPVGSAAAELHLTVAWDSVDLVDVEASAPPGESRTTVRSRLTVPLDLPVFAPLGAHLAAIDREVAHRVAQVDERRRHQVVLDTAIRVGAALDGSITPTLLVELDDVAPTEQRRLELYPLIRATTLRGLRAGGLEPIPEVGAETLLPEPARGRWEAVTIGEAGAVLAEGDGVVGLLAHVAEPTIAALLIEAQGQR